MKDNKNIETGNKKDREREREMKVLVVEILDLILWVIAFSYVTSVKDSQDFEFLRLFLANLVEESV